MAIVNCPRCGAKNRVDERAANNLQPVCGRCGTKLAARTGETATSGTGASGTGGGGDGNRPQTVSDATFVRDVLNASLELPVMLDCWAVWCGPCRMVAPVLDELAAESGGRYRIAKLNVDENPQTAAQLGIQSIPTLFIFKNGNIVDRIIGAQSKQVLAARLAAHA